MTVRCTTHTMIADRNLHHAAIAPIASPPSGCCRARALTFTEIDVSGDPKGEATMVERANGRMTVPQIFIGSTHVGGYDDLYALEHAGKLDPLLGGGDGRRRNAEPRHERSHGATFTAGLVQMRSGLSPQANLDAAVQADRRGQERRRRLRADAGDDQHHGGQARAAVRARSRPRRTTRASRPSASSRASSASICMSARSRSRCRPRRPPTARS